MEDLLKRVPLPQSATVEVIQATILELHPPADHRNYLPPAADDPPMGATTQLTADQVREKFYSLKKKNTAAENTGWSYKLRMLGDDRSDDGYIHKVTVPTQLHLAFTAFLNKILQGIILGEGGDLLVTARLIMIPKPQGGLRPICIECAL